MKQKIMGNLEREERNNTIVQNGSMFKGLKEKNLSLDGGQESIIYSPRDLNYAKKGYKNKNMYSEMSRAELEIVKMKQKEKNALSSLYNPGMFGKNGKKSKSPKKMNKTDFSSFDMSHYKNEELMPVGTVIEAMYRCIVNEDPKEDALKHQNELLTEIYDHT